MNMSSFGGTRLTGSRFPGGWRVEIQLGSSGFSPSGRQFTTTSKLEGWFYLQSNTNIHVLLNFIVMKLIWIYDSTYYPDVFFIFCIIT